MTMEVMAHGFPAGQVKQSITSITLVNNTTKTVDTTVPAGEKWIIQSIKAVNSDDVARDVYVLIYKEVAKTNEVRRLIKKAATVTGERVVYPSNSANTNIQYAWAPQVLVAGNTISTTWVAGGASGGATDADGLVIDYLRIPE